jgi:DeoR/GlpR family transcriptional regulator of sugar metabolism
MLWPAVIALSAIEKLGTAEAYHVCDTEKLSVIVTDQPENLNDTERYQALGITVV